MELIREPTQLAARIRSLFTLRIVSSNKVSQRNDCCRLLQSCKLTSSISWTFKKWRTCQKTNRQMSNALPSLIEAQNRLGATGELEMTCKSMRASLCQIFHETFERSLTSFWKTQNDCRASKKWNPSMAYLNNYLSKWKWVMTHLVMERILPQICSDILTISAISVRITETKRVSLLIFSDPKYIFLRP